MKNDNYIVTVIDENYNYALVESAPVFSDTNKIVIKDGARLGSTPESALLVNNIMINCFEDDAKQCFDWDHSLIANEECYLRVLDALAKTLVIDGDLFTLEYNGEVIEPDADGKINCLFTDLALGDDAIVKVTAKTDAVLAPEIKEEGSKFNYFNSIGESSLNFSFESYVVGQKKYINVLNNSNFASLVELSGEGFTYELFPEYDSFEILPHSEIQIEITTTVVGEISFEVVHNRETNP